ncbi:DNA-directed RNA polymerase subunit delta [Oceanobacillus sp. FSL H7-0719]|uniref:DNA-directed RNA polymerase subunit delta n=1 Tax=Oceanobacillus sp. FSL H7-0719 TaxID=2954507 RepID=UPI00324A8B08
MSLDKFSHEELKKKSMLELASLILRDEKKALSFQEIYDQIAEIKGFTKKLKEENIAQFFTELNVDGRFMTLGSNVWGLKQWYPVDQADEEITPAPKAKRKSKKKKDYEDDEDEESLEFDDEEELLELGEEADDEEELDELDEDEEDFGEELDADEEELEEDLSLDEEDDEEEENI